VSRPFPTNTYRAPLTTFRSAMNEIKSLRKQRGLTQKEAAEKLDMNARTFGSYERGERTPDYKTMDRIRRVLKGLENGEADREVKGCATMVTGTRTRTYTRAHARPRTRTRPRTHYIPW